MWHLGGRVFGAKAWLADHVTFFNCKVPGLPTGNVESWNFIAKRIEGTCMNIRIIYGEKGCKAQKLAIPALSSDSGYNFTTAKFTCPCLVPSILLFAFCSAKERLAVISQISDHHSSGGYTVSFTFDRLPFGTTSFYIPFR